MKDEKIKYGIKHKLLTFFISIFIILVLLNAYLVLNALDKTKQSSLDIGNNILIKQTKEYYKNFTNSQKETLALLFNTVEEDVRNLNEYTTKLYENQQNLNTKKYWDYRQNLTHLPNNQLIEKDGNTSTLWSPTWMEVNEKVLKKIEISAFINEHFEPLLARNENTVANYFLGSEGFLRYYPRVNMLELFPSDFRTIDDIYFLPATPQNNPQRKLKWTPLYKDPAGQGLMISAISPIYLKDEFIGVVGTDMTLDKLVEHYIKENPFDDSYSILLDKDFRPIALPKKAIEDIYKKEITEDSTEIEESLLKYDSAFRVVLNKIKDNDYGFEKIELEDKNLYISYVRLEKLHWFYANILKEEEVLSATKMMSSDIDILTNKLVINFSLITLFVLIASIFLISYLINKFLHPISTLSNITKKISEGNLEEKIDIEGKDEVKILIKNFKKMQDAISKQQKELEKFNKQLQQKVYERTEELEESNEELQTTISNLKQTQKQLIEAEKFASLGSLVAGVAHEINTPIGIGLTGITHLLEETNKINKLYSEEKMSEEDFEYYLQSAKDLSNLINTNLNRTAQLVKSFKQISVDQTNEEKRYFNLKDYIDDILFSLQNITKKTNIKINLEINDDIRINSYPGYYSQIFTNLIINSIIHGFEEKQEGKIDIKIKKEAEYLTINYQDTGKGIKEENLNKIFDPFFTTNRENGGTGLGMNIIYNIITNQLSGTIKCNSKENQGVEFIISLKIQAFKENMC